MKRLLSLLAFLFLPVADADMDAAAQGAYVGLFLNQGQCCCAGSRVFVERHKHDEFLEKLQKLTEQRDPA